MQHIQKEERRKRPNFESLHKNDEKNGDNQQLGKWPNNLKN